MAKKRRVTAAPEAAPRMTKRQTSRYERERRQRAILWTVTAAAALVIVGLIGFGILRDQVLLPRETVLTVNGVPISRETYWKVRRFDLGRQFQQLQFQMQFGGQGAQAAQQRLEALQRDLRQYRTAPLDVPTLERLATNELLRQRAGTLGVTVDEAELQEKITQDFAPPPATPTPVSPAEATQTAVAATAVATLTPQPTPAPTRASVTGTPEPTATPTSGPTATPTPFVTATPTHSPTPMDEAARATALSTFRDQAGALRNLYGMSPEDYRTLVVLPELLEERIKARIAQDVPAVQPQVRAAHILVPSEEAARQVKEDLARGADFAALARERSTDPGSKEKGGDLDWFSRGVMASEFEQAAFQLEPGTISEPVKTQFGWHIIKVLEKSEARPVVPNVLEQARDSRYDTWLKEQRASSTVTGEVALPNFMPAPTPEATAPAKP